MSTPPRIDPANYLKGLQWDGTARMDKWLVHVLGESAESLGALRHEYLALVGRFWLLGMVCRAMEPGHSFGYVPVLVGPPGTGKSTLLQALAGPCGHGDAALDLHRARDVAEQLQGFWLYELVELRAFDRQTEQLKALVTARSDSYRPAYGQGMETVPRRLVFVATTGAWDFLPARAQERRFWPITVPRPLNTAWVERTRDQLFAEAFAYWQQGMECMPTAEQEARVFKDATRLDVTQTALYGRLLELLEREPEVALSPFGQLDRSTEFVTLTQLVTALGVAPARTPRGLEEQIRAALESMGWQRVKRPVGAMQAWGYQRPAREQGTGITAPRAPSPQSQPEHSGSPRMQPECSSEPSFQTRLPPATPQPLPRFVRHAQSLFRRFGFQLTWVPAGDMDGVEGSSLVISRTPASAKGRGGES